MNAHGECATVLRAPTTCAYARAKAWTEASYIFGLPGPGPDRSARALLRVNLTGDRRIQYNTSTVHACMVTIYITALDGIIRSGGWQPTGPHASPPLQHDWLLGSPCTSAEVILEPLRHIIIYPRI